MRLDIPAPLKAEHHELHARLVRATQEPGVLGEAAREVARLLHPHFVKEEAFGLPPLGLLSEVALGAVRADMAEVLVMTRRIKAELPAMFAEHRQIAAALEVLRREARRAGRADLEEFATALQRHAETEELVLYPAAVLLGEYLARVLEEEPAL